MKIFPLQVLISYIYGENCQHRQPQICANQITVASDSRKSMVYIAHSREEALEISGWRAFGSGDFPVLSRIKGKHQHKCVYSTF